jgi:hypothetical protein
VRLVIARDGRLIDVPGRSLERRAGDRHGRSSIAVKRAAPFSTAAISRPGRSRDVLIPVTYELR